MIRNHRVTHQVRKVPLAREIKDPQANHLQAEHIQDHLQDLDQEYLHPPSDHQLVLRSEVEGGEMMYLKNSTNDPD